MKNIAAHPQQVNRVLQIPGALRSRLKRRFDKKWIPEPNSGCWVWTAGGNPRGYGFFAIDGRPRLAHRISWMIYVGAIPEDENYHGVCVLHKCDNPPCVNPSHLFLGTPQDNYDDMVAKGRRVSAGANKTHCKHGHLYDEENTRFYKSVWRQCKKCARIRCGYRGLKNHTHCPKGHEYTPENTYLYLRKDTGCTMRQCRACRRIYKRLRREKIAALKARELRDD